MSNRIVHMTSVHSRYDIRIFIKMCSSLAENKDFEVFLVVADGLGDEMKNGVNIVDVGKTKGRWKRMFLTTKKVFKSAQNLAGDIYHLHDPELIPTGLKLLKQNKNVIFDAHEDLPKQIKGKPYLPSVLRSVLPYLVEWYEKYATPKFTYIITATPTIRDKFLNYTTTAIDINNFPIAGELMTVSKAGNRKSNQVCYIGAITKIRGIDEMLQAISSLEGVSLVLVGKFAEPNLEDSLKKTRDWENVVETGFLNREGVKDVLSNSFAGLVTLLPSPNHIDSLPNKMFEYMSAGVPIIASDFPLWKQIIDETGCGIHVNPENPEEIKTAISYLMKNPEEARKMGENGYNAILTKYNWASQLAKLNGIYETILVAGDKS
ncbi:glycosyltransferase family 4 protein [Thiomicrorhabdus lithotrophica]|uniref:Glycosyltransferase family 4 protein n=1 Tax=Thiomicrorhabdus lithotrophica TaxID=2949997 RepID=A0ABY8CFF8_9GAMM|nr:glycosyltransferase family 4 protein [Thiomicrorhabdus lithotrophica]WEJ63148.1 glycosyltransferase family 4 protein [Thiomicrorhabdus lithotrophica]